MRWFRALMPREERFFDLFARHSDVVVAGAKALRDMLDGGDAVARNYKTVMDREHDADNITREVLIAVRRTFITPFDRGDVKDLITLGDMERRGMRILEVACHRYPRRGKLIIARLIAEHGRDDHGHLGALIAYDCPKLREPSDPMGVWLATCTA